MPLKLKRRTQTTAPLKAEPSDPTRRRRRQRVANSTNSLPLPAEVEPGPDPTELREVKSKDAPRSPLTIQVGADGERVTLEASKEIVLRCGKSSLTLTRAGKIIIRGKYVLSDSSGVNRIQGGSVQIN